MKIMHFFLHLLSANDQVDFWDGDNLTGNRTSVTTGSTITEFSPVSLNILGDRQQHFFSGVCVSAGVHVGVGIGVCLCVCVCVCVYVCVPACVSG